MRIHTNRATVKGNREELFLSLSRAFPHIVYRLLQKMLRKFKAMHAEVPYQPVLAGQLLVPLRLVRPMIVCLLKGTTMVIKVSYQAPADSMQSRSRLSKYFEVNDIPPRQRVVRRLRMLAVNFDEQTLSIEPCHEDLNTMRRAGYLVFRF